MPNPESSDQAGPGPASSSDEAITQLTQRIEELEHRYSDLLEVENRWLRATVKSADSGDRTIESVTTQSVPYADLSAPTYLPAALLEIEKSCAKMELRARVEDWDGVREAKLAASSGLCRSLRRYSEDPDLSDRLEATAQHAPLTRRTSARCSITPLRFHLQSALQSHWHNSTRRPPMERFSWPRSRSFCNWLD